jgi:hypothetical protein
MQDRLPIIFIIAAMPQCGKTERSSLRALFKEHNVLLGTSKTFV